MILATLAAAAPLSICAPVPGSEQLWANPGTRYVMVGETHGTNEVPALFADLVCAASEKRKVVVALEHPPEEKPAIDAFLKSDGGAAARAAFLKTGIWTNFRDGRNSLAMLSLYEQLRKWKQAGRIEAVVPFSAYDLSVPFSNANEGANRGMAQALENTAKAHPNALVLGFGGSVHMSVADVMGTKVKSAAGRLPRREVTTVFIDGDTGSAWNCIGTTCGVHEMMAFRAPSPRGVTKPSAYPLPGFDFVASVGRPMSASSPAVPPAAGRQ
jgi:hypothetical protein